MTAFLDNIFGKKQATSPRRVVGIDLGSTSIKVVELESRDNVINLTTYGEILIGPYGDGSLGDAITLDPKQEQTALIDVFRESAVQATSAVFAVHLASSFVTVINLPKLGPDTDVAGQVPVEARKYIPMPINEVTLDWAEITRAEQDKAADHQEVLLAAIQNEVLQRLNTLMQRTNLPDQPTEIECFSIIRSVYQANYGERVAIIDLGGSSAKLYVVRQGLLEQLHRVRSGGTHITKQLAEDLSTDFTDAEVRKREYDGASDEIGYTIRRVHEKMLGKTLHELQQVLQNYEKDHGSEIDKVILTGGVTQYPQITGLVEEALSRKTVVGNPFNKVAYPAFMEDVIKEIGPTFAVALGAALQRFE